MPTYFCTTCGEPQPNLGQFCTACGAPIDPGTVQAALGSSPSATVRLPETEPPAATPTIAVTPSSAVAGPVSGTMPRPVPSAVPGGAPRSLRNWLGGRLRARTLGIAAGGIVLLLAILLVFRGAMPFSTRAYVDRMVTTVRNGDNLTLLLMRSDGSSQVTLLDEPADPLAHPLAVTQLGDDHLIRNTLTPGAAILVLQQRVVFWHWMADGLEIRSMNLDGEDAITMVQGAQASALVLPESGKQILLIEHTPGTDRGPVHGRLSVVDLRGQMTTLVQDVPQVDGILAPDGSHVAYWSSDEDGQVTLKVVDATGGNVVEVARNLADVSARFSKDSSKLFINRSADDGRLFQVADADGQNLVTLSRAGGYGRGEVAQGRLVYAVSEAGETTLFSSALNGDDRVEIVRGAEDLDWDLTPEQDKIIYAQTRNGAHVLRITDLQHTTTNDLKRSDSDRLFWRFLDTGRLLVIRGNQGGGGFTISTMRQDGSDEQVLKRAIDIEALDVDGSQVAVAGREDRQGVVYLLDGTAPLLLDDEADSYSQVHFTPDGQILYTAQFNSGSVLYRIDQKGKQRQLIEEEMGMLATGF